MGKNESTIDRVIRLIVGIVALVVAGMNGWTSGALAIIALIVGVIMLVTAAVGFCPLYRLFGIRTNKA